MKKKYVYKNINFDSDEEIAFYQWCEEAKELELITEFIYQPISYLLFKSDITYPRLTKKGNISNKVLLREHKYTPDYCIILTQLCRNLYFNIFKFPDENLKVYIDVKGDFTKSDREKRFILNQKWTFKEYGIYVQKIVPYRLFEKTWVPEIQRWQPKRKMLRKHYKDFKLKEDIKKMIGEKHG